MPLRTPDPFHNPASRVTRTDSLRKLRALPGSAPEVSRAEAEVAALAGAAVVSAEAEDLGVVVAAAAVPDAEALGHSSLDNSVTAGSLPLFMAWCFSR